MAPTVRKAVIPAAGLGTRFLPATKAIPKEMLPIVDVPTIQIVIEEAVSAGICDIVVISGRGKVEIEDHFDHAFELEHTLRERGKHELAEQLEHVATMARLISVRQKQPLGLGHAVLCGRVAVGDEPFAVMLGDDLVDNDDAPAIGQLCAVHAQTGAAVIGIVEVPPGHESMYGIVAGDPDPRGWIQVRQMVEKPAPGTAPSRLAVVGRYVLPPAIWPILESTRPGAGGEIQLTDALIELIGTGTGVCAVPLQGVRHDAGNALGWLRANLAYGLKRPELRDGLVSLMKDLLADVGRDEKS